MVKKYKQQKNNELPLVAIDLGSDSIRAIAAQQIEQDLFQILGVEESRKHRCIEQGVITQTTNAGFMINQTLRLLANRIHMDELPTAFITLGGHSMRMTPVKSQRDQLRRREIKPELLEEMAQECIQKIEAKYPTIAVLDLIPSYFILDGIEQENIPAPPQRASIIEAHYIAFYGRKELKTKTDTAFTQAGKSIEHAFIRPDALLSVFAAADGNQILDDGCALIDMGAQTTSLSIYKNGQYLCQTVIPQGGYHITRFIEQQGIPYHIAERLKKDYGYASPTLIDKNYRLSFQDTQGEQAEIYMTDLAEIIQTKLQEILSHILPNIQEHKDRIATIYLTGGASMLQGTDTYIQQLTNIPVRYGGHDNLLTYDTPDIYCTPTYSALIGTLLLGQDYREQHPNQDIKKPKTIIETLTTKINEFFTEND